jgi:hypothetical protein
MLQIVIGTSKEYEEGWKYFKINLRSQEYNDRVCTFSMLEALGSIPSTKEKE